MQNLPPISSPDGPPVVVPPQADTQIDAPALAKAQKLVLWAMLASVATVLMALAVQSYPTAVILITLVRLLLSLFMAYAVFGLARALKIKWAWLAAILAFLPLIGLVVLLSFNGKATTKLREAGYAVGLMGAKKKAA